MILDFEETHVPRGRNHKRLFTTELNTNTRYQAKNMDSYIHEINKCLTRVKRLSQLYTAGQ